MGLTPAVAYYRMSSDKQETSIGDQRTAVEAYAAKNSYRITHEYRDEGISGWKSEQRESFQRLIEDAKGGNFKAVLCWDQDRFSRFPVLEANHYWYLLDRAGVHIATVAQGRLNFDDLGEWLKASVVQHGKAEYVRDLSRNVTRGRRTLALEGQWSTIAPYGYRLNERRLVLGDAHEVATVRRIFTLRAQGYGYYAIAKKLNDARLTTARGTPWRKDSIRRMTCSETYIGTTVLGRKARGKYSRVLDREMVFENTHPAIVDRDTWDAVQAMLTQPRRAHSRCGNEGAPLSGLLRCGRCGSPMYTRSLDSSYVCSSYTTHGKCGFCTVDREPLIAAVAAKLRQKLLLGDPKRLEAAIQRQLDRRCAAKPDDDAAVANKLAALDRQIARAADRILMVDDSLVPELETRLLALKEQRDRLAESIEPREKTKRVPSAKAIAAKVWELDHILSTAPASVVRHTLAQLIDHIRLDFESAGKTYRGEAYRFTGGTICFRAQETQRSGSAQRMD